MRLFNRLPASISAPATIRPGVAKTAAFFGTIRGRILIAFLIMSMFTAALGGFAVLSIKRAGLLVEKTFDESLMSINYARAAAADFAAMRAAFAQRWITPDPDARARLDRNVDALRQSLAEDLAIAAKRSQSVRAAQAAMNVQRAALDWDRVRLRLLSGDQPDINWDRLERYAGIVDKQVDLLVNYTAGDGFIYRQRARESVTRETELNIAGTIIVLLFAAVVAWLLARRVIGPVAVASEVAERIANAELDVEIPRGSADELGALLSAMRRMRDNIKVMMDREVEQRRLAQIRLADALESSREGVVVADAEGKLVLANSPAADFLGISRDLLRSGIPIGDLGPVLAHSMTGELPATDEALLADGRWLRISRSATRDGGFIVVCGDISVLKAQEATLKEANLQLDAALDNMSQGLCLYDAEYKLIVVNRRFCEIFGLHREQLRPGITFPEVLELSVAAGNYSGKTASDLLAEQMDFVGPNANGMHYHELSGGRVVASVHRPTSDGGWVATYEDVTERRQAEAKIIHMARHDALTNLPNRILFQEQMEQALARVDRDESLAVLYLDLDRFKSVNDSLGHPIGDALLCAVTDRLQAMVRAGDIVARLGGDEFAIVQTGASQPNGAKNLATRVIDTIAQPFDIEGHQIIVGTSIGVAVAPTDGNEPDQLLRNADMALYRAKAEGRGTYHFFQREMDEQTQARRILELELRKALTAGEFELYYQPLIDVATSRISGFEALVRWNHPTRGMVAPGQFIALAEEIGLIGPLGEWVLRKACAEAANWEGNLSVSVNLSPAQFRNNTVVLSVVSALGASGLAATRLELEITETVLLEDTAAVLDALHQLRVLGVRISLDDFGTGYSSMSYLRSFPFDKIKIDRSFVAELGKKNDGVAIIRAVTGLGSSFGMTTTAEGVETQEQLDILRTEGCTQVQGYLFSPPRPAKEIPLLLEALNPPRGGRGARPRAARGLAPVPALQNFG
jgi:diguanylate cyclase (GGDEF)-like protein/PAS domain S-box-containing protein